MSYFQYPTGSVLLRLSFAVVITTSASGCLHALGLARPSISPRASLEMYDDSTVRAQDDDVPKPANSEHQRPAQAASGYSNFPSAITQTTASPGSTTQEPHNTSVMPNARLLTPQFGGTPGAGVSTQTTGQNNRRPDQTVSASLNLPVEAVTPSPQSLGFSAEQVRAIMNRQSQSEMATGNVLADQPNRWSVLASQSQSAERTTGASPASTGTVPAKAVGTSRVVNSLAVDGQGIAEAAKSAEAAVVPESHAEPSMLERLKGFYEPENAARKIWKRPFQKLGNPWTAVFGDRDEPPQVTEATVDPESVRTAEVSPEAAKSVAGPLLAQLITATEAELAAWPTKLDGSPVELEKHQRRQLDLRLLYLIANQPGKAIRAVEELSGAEQDFWQELMLAMAEYRSQSTVDKEERLTNTTGQLRSAVRQLSPLTSLQIRRFEICNRIHSFGRLDTFPANNFDPGQPLLLYAEVDNFAAELTATGSYRTQFEAELKLYEEGNTKAKETIALPDISDESTSERSDYYQSFELSLPSHLKSGQYSIRLRLRDRISGKTAESTVEFQVRQPESAELADSL